MRWPTVGARDRRALRLGAWLVVPALFVALAVRPYQRARRAVTEDLSGQRALLARELGALRDAPRDAAAARLAKQSLSEAQLRLFAAADVVAASAQLASYVSERAAEYGVDIEESETSAPLDSTTVAAVDISATGRVFALVEFLRALEDGPKLARVDRMTLAPAPGGHGGGGTVTLRMSVASRSIPTAHDSSVDTLTASPSGRR